MSEAFRGLVWRGLNYSSWPEYSKTELGAVMPISRDDRRAVIAELRSDGLSTRAIAAEVGCSEATVRNDLSAGAQHYAPADGASGDQATITGKDGKQYRATNKRRVSASTRRRIVKYLREHPDATVASISEQLHVSKADIPIVAREIGHVWASKRGPKPPPPPPLPDPAHALAYEPKQVVHVLRMCESMASDNGRMHYAQHLISAMREGDEAWVDEQRQALEYVLAYLGDFLRCHTDQEFRSRLNTGWEGRDDIADQQVTSRRLRAVQ